MSPTDESHKQRLLGAVSDMMRPQVDAPSSARFKAKERAKLRGGNAAEAYQLFQETRGKGIAASIVDDPSLITTGGQLAKKLFSDGQGFSERIKSKGIIETLTDAATGATDALMTIAPEAILCAATTGFTLPGILQCTKNAITGYAMSNLSSSMAPEQAAEPLVDELRQQMSGVPPETTDQLAVEPLQNPGIDTPPGESAPLPPVQKKNATLPVDNI
jgi:hypothetical protein